MREPDLRRQIEVAQANLRRVVERGLYGWTLVADRWRREIARLRRLESEAAPSSRPAGSEEAPQTWACGLCARIGTNDLGGPRVHAPGCSQAEARSEY